MVSFRAALGAAFLLLAASRAEPGPLEDGIELLDRGQYTSAAEAFEEAAAAGRTEAMVELGRMRLEGLGGQPDRQAAAAWFAKAADRGSTEGQYLLGLTILQGVEGEGDAREAARWFERAASTGSSEAAYNLAVLHDNGRGVPKDIAKALKLYRQAADGGVLEAEHALGSMLAFGRGVRPDVVEGGVWLEVARAAGDTDVTDELTALRRNFTPAQAARIKAGVLAHQKRSPHH